MSCLVKMAGRREVDPRFIPAPFSLFDSLFAPLEVTALNGVDDDWERTVCLGSSHIHRSIRHARQRRATELRSFSFFSALFAPNSLKFHRITCLPSAAPLASSCATPARELGVPLRHDPTDIRLARLLIVDCHQLTSPLVTSQAAITWPRHWTRVGQHSTTNHRPFYQYDQRVLPSALPVSLP